MKALWHGVVLAESDRTIVVEGNHYFPADSINVEYLRPSASHTMCSWKGTASYYDVAVDDLVNVGAAWYYPDPSQAAAPIGGYVAFWRGVTVSD